MSGGGSSVLRIAVAVIGGLAMVGPGFGGAVLAQSPAPVLGDAGMGTGSAPHAAGAGDGAPDHLRGQAPAPGDGSASPVPAGSAANAAPGSSSVLSQAAPVHPLDHAAARVRLSVPPSPGPAMQAGGAAPAPAAPSVGPASAPAVAQPSPAAGPSSVPAPPAGGAVATAPAATPDPLMAVAEKIEALLAQPGAVPGSAKEQEAMAAFYGARAHAPVFVTPSGLSPRGKAVAARLAAAGEDGLAAADYPQPRLAPGADADELARAELRLAASALLYARHAQAGRFDPARISGLVTPVRSFPDPLAVLDDLSLATEPGAALQAYNPPHAGFRALKAKLAALPAQVRPAPSARIPAGPTLREGDMDGRVPLLRARLGLSPAAGTRIYDGALPEAVRAFQRENGLSPDGIVGAATVAALNRAPSSSGAGRADILSNMERWRWLPRDLGDAYVMVNIPEYMVRVVDAGRVVHETRVVVGKPDTPTPLLSRDMTYVVVNPYWNIPPTIARKEMLPNLQRDPYYLSRQGMEIVRNGRVVDPASVNWARGLSGYSFRQPPGERNALGRIKFMFPNDHAVYLHDTPSQRLFANDRRAYSHGCIRVYEPLAFGEAVFNIGMQGGNWSPARISKMFGASERYLTLKRKIPVHLVYFTTFVDESGRLRSREDVYGFDARTKELIGLGAPGAAQAGRPMAATR